MLEGDHLTFDHLAEHSLTWWLTHFRCDHCFIYTKANCRCHTPLWICAAATNRIVSVIYGLYNPTGHCYRLFIRDKGHLSHPIISWAQTQSDDFKVECLKREECLYESSEWLVADTGVQIISQLTSLPAAPIPFHCSPLQHLHYYWGRPFKKSPATSST